MRTDEIRAVTEKATPGKWEAPYIGFEVSDQSGAPLFYGVGDGEQTHNDMDFVAQARQWVPDLCDEVERIRAENAVLKRALELACDLEAQDNCQDVSQVVNEYIRDAVEIAHFKREEMGK